MPKPIGQAWCYTATGVRETTDDPEVALLGVLTADERYLIKLIMTVQGADPSPSGQSRIAFNCGLMVGDELGATSGLGVGIGIDRGYVGDGVNRYIQQVSSQFIMTPDSNALTLWVSAETSADEQISWALSASGILVP